MSELRGWLTPEARATVEAVLAKLAAPGMCNPADDTPCVDGTPTQEAIEGDTRSHRPTQPRRARWPRCARLLASGELGQHNGLPASIIVTTTLKELEAAAGKWLTGGGTILPMSDVIRLARHARHYLAIFDKGKALALYHTKRLASPGQRIVLYAKERGCSAPGCTVPGYYCEVHHVTDYAKCRTDRRQRPDLHLRTPTPHPPTRRLEHPQKHPRRHRMDPTPTVRARPTPNQHFSSSRKTPPLRGRRRVVISVSQPAWRECTR